MTTKITDEELAACEQEVSEIFRSLVPPTGPSNDADALIPDWLASCARGLGTQPILTRSDLERSHCDAGKRLSPQDRIDRIVQRAQVELGDGDLQS